MKKNTPRHFPYQHPTFGTNEKPKPKEFWENTVFYLWWCYLKRSSNYKLTCDAEGKEGLVELYKDFGDVRGDCFKDWWIQDNRGVKLFGEPIQENTVRVVNKDEINMFDDEQLLFTIPLNLPQKHIHERLKKIISTHHKGKRGRQNAKSSKALYRFTGQPNIQGMKNALKVFDFLTANPSSKLWEVGRIFPQFQMELLENEKNGVKTSYDFKRKIEATVSRYKRKAYSSIKNVEQGKFP